jgi:hypothetical protein
MSNLLLIILLIFVTFTTIIALKCKMALISNEVSTDLTELSDKKILAQMIDIECSKEVPIIKLKLFTGGEGIRDAGGVDFFLCGEKKSGNGGPAGIPP